MKSQLLQMLEAVQTRLEAIPTLFATEWGNAPIEVITVKPPNQTEPGADRITNYEQALETKTLAAGGTVVILVQAAEDATVPENGNETPEGLFRQTILVDVTTRPLLQNEMIEPALAGECVARALQHFRWQQTSTTQRRVQVRALKQGYSTDKKFFITKIRAEYDLRLAPIS